MAQVALGELNYLSCWHDFEDNISDNIGPCLAFWPSFIEGSFISHNFLMLKLPAVKKFGCDYDNYSNDNIGTCSACWSTFIVGSFIMPLCHDRKNVKETILLHKLFSLF